MGAVIRKGWRSRREPARADIKTTRWLIEALESRVLLSGGTLDPTFGSNGISTWLAASPVNSAIEQPDGKFLVTGCVPSTAASGDAFGVTRLNADGSLDTSFGKGGSALAATSQGQIEYQDAVAIALQSDGKILVGGNVNPNALSGNPYSDFALARLNADGTPDTSFGVGGVVTTHFGTFARIDSLAVQPDGKIIAAGDDTGRGYLNGFLAARYNIDGSPDLAFGGGTGHEAVSAPNAPQLVPAIALQPDGDILVGGSQYAYPGPAALARLQPNGALDPTFGSGGIASDIVYGTIGAIALQTNGEMDVATNDGQGIRLARLHSDGSPDFNFGQAGHVNAGLFPPETQFAQIAMARQPDGRILLAGSNTTSPNSAKIELKRYNSDGTLDLTFGLTGTGAAYSNPTQGAQPSASTLLLSGDNKAVVLGTLGAVGSMPEYGVAAQFDLGPTASPTASAITVAGFSSFIAPGIESPLTATVKDANGDIATAFSGTLHFSSSDPLAKLPADYTFTSADQGTHTFDISLGTIGMQSITVFDAADGASGAESGIDVHAPDPTLLPITDHTDTIYDPVRQRLYVVSSHGTIQRYDVATQTLLSPIVLIPQGEAGTLGSGDITPDGKYLYIPRQDDAGGRALIYKINLSNNAIAELTFSAASGESGPVNLKIAANGIGLISTREANFSPTLRQIDIATDAITLRDDLPSLSAYFGAPFSINRGEDRSVLVLEQSLGSDSFFTYDASTNSFSSAHAGVGGEGGWIVNRTGTLLAGNGGTVLNQKLETIRELNVASKNVFDPQRDELYLANYYTDTIDVYDTNTWAIKARIARGMTYPGPLQASDDGRYLYMSAPDGIHVYNIADAPTAVAGGPYTAKEGSPLTLSGAGSSSVQHPIVSYEWDFNYDGSTFHTDAGGIRPLFPTSAVDGPTTRTVALRVTDSAGHVAIATTTVTIADAPPVLSASAPSWAWTGQRYAIRLSARDPGPDPIQSWTIDWGDGEPAQSIAGNPSWVWHVYAAASGAKPFTIYAAATNADGTFAAKGQSVTVYTAPLPASDGTLSIHEFWPLNYVKVDSSSGELRVQEEGLIESLPASEVSAINIETGGPGLPEVAIGSNLPPVNLQLDRSTRVSMQNGASGDAPITIHASAPHNTVVIPADASANVNFTGSGTDALWVGNEILTNPASRHIAITSSSVSIQAPASGVNVNVAYSGVAALIVSGGGGDCTFDVNVPTGPSLQVEGGVGNNVFNVTATPSTGRTSFLSIGRSRGMNTFFARDGVQESIFATGGKSYAVVDPSDKVSGVSFVTGGNLSGTVYDDLNGNAKRDPGEAALAGVTVFVDSNDNGIIDPGEPTSVTDANGGYQFTTANLIPSLYSAPYVHLGIVAPAGYSRQFDQQVRLPGANDETGADLHLVPPPALLSSIIGNGSAQRSVVKSVTLSFSQTVYPDGIAAASLFRRNTGGSGADDGSAPTDLSADVLISNSGPTWRITFLPRSPAADAAGRLMDGIYDLVIHASGVYSVGGHPTADQTITFHTLFGDINGDGAVNGADYFSFRHAYGSVAGSTNYNPAFDYDSNGRIDLTDQKAFAARFGKRFTY